MRKKFRVAFYLFLFISLLSIQPKNVNAEDQFKTGEFEITNLSEETQFIDFGSEYDSFYISFSTVSQSIDSVSFEYSTSRDNNKWNSWSKESLSNEILSKNSISNTNSDNLAESKAQNYSDESDLNVVSDQIQIPQTRFIKIKVANKADITKFKVYTLKDKINSNNIVASENPSYNFNYLGGINIITRNEWGCPDQDPNSPYNCNNPDWHPMYFPTTHIIVHHTVTSNNVTDWKREVRNIWYSHSHVRDVDPDDGVQGWTDIGYNFLIDPNGEIYEGRYGGEGVTGGHVTSHNNGTVGISMIGTYSEADITPAARQSLNNLVIALSARYRFNPYEVAPDSTGIQNPRLSGHRDWQQTACPGNTLYSTIPSLRSSTEYKSTVLANISLNIDPCPSGYTLFDNKCYRYSTVTSWANAGETPVSLAADQDGNIYSANFNSAQISKTTHTQSHEVIGNTGQKPRGITIDSLGNIYTANYSDKTVTKLDTEGNTSILANLQGKPYAITTDNSNNIYTANIDIDTVSKITPWGGVTDYEVGYNPTAIVVDQNGNIYTSNYLSNTITKITSSGDITTIRLNGTNPMDLIVDNGGNIYTANYGTHDISKIDQYGNVTRFAVVDKKPTSIAIDSNGYLYTIHENSNLISKVSLTGLVDVFSSTNQNPKDIIAAGDDVFIANFDTHNLSLLTISDESIPLTQPIYRFWGDSSKSHFYTSNTDERNNVISNAPASIWRYEGIGFYAFTDPNSTQGLTPAYRFWSPTRQKHFYTINEEEKNNLIATDPNWSFEGIAYYTFSSEAIGTEPVYRFWSGAKQSHFYTSNPLEKENIIQNDSSWTYEGIGFYTFR